VVSDASAMRDLRPEQIARVEVIKGSAAGGRYADPRAEHGVILITTKK
jgi:hypothetical protein